jgi:anion-transporting  ArsA/GET3 family ATPase
MTATFADLIDETEVILCCGTGGVGKTTSAAALAVASANRGRHVVVVTCAPAGGRAVELALVGLANDCVSVHGFDPGEMWVTMLDTKATFDRLIERHARDVHQAARILDNRYYRNLSSSLSGTREFMAMERLYELHNDDRFDLVIVDTPPSRNALDFLDAPDRLGRFLDGRLFRLAAPGNRATRRLTAPVMVAMRRIARVISPEVVDDTLAFIEAFSGMEDGFKERARAVDALLGNERTAFVLVSSPMVEAIEESRYFADRLSESDIDVDAIVLNRLQPRFTTVDLTALDTSGLPPEAAAQVKLLADLAGLAVAENAAIGPLLDRCPDACVARIEQLDYDVHDLAGIRDIAARLLQAG